jgi:hypothetical protein
MNKSRQRLRVGITAAMALWAAIWRPVSAEAATLGLPASPAAP